MDMTGNGMYYEHKDYKSKNIKKKSTENNTLDTSVMCNFFKIYVENKYDDPHSRFAEITGLSRQEAKALCYKIAYKLSKAEIMQGYLLKLGVK